MSAKKKSTSKKSTKAIVTYVSVASLCKAIALECKHDRVDALAKSMRGKLRKRFSCYAIDFVKLDKFDRATKGQANISIESDTTKQLVGVVSFHEGTPHKMSEESASIFFLDKFVTCLPSSCKAIKEMSHTQLVKFVKSKARLTTSH